MTAPASSFLRSAKVSDATTQPPATLCTMPPPKVGEAWMASGLSLNSRKNGSPRERLPSIDDEKRPWHSSPPPSPPSTLQEAHTLPSDEQESAPAVDCPYHKVFLFSMMAFGLIHPYRLANVGAHWRIPLLVYSVTIFTCLAFNLVRLSATSFGAYESDLSALLYIPRITFLAWHLTTVLAIAILFSMSLSGSRGLAAYYAQLSDTTRRLAAAGVPANDRNKRRMELIAIITAWSFCVVNAAYTLPTLVDPSQFTAIENVIRWRLDNGTTVTEYRAMRVVESLALMFGIGAYIFPVVYVVVVSAQVAQLMGRFNTHLSTIADDRPAELLERIAFYRLLHRSLCEAAGRARGLLDYLIAVHMVIAFLLSMLQLYFVVSVADLDQYKSLKVSAAVWFLIALSIMVSEFVAGCALGERASECSEHLERIADDQETQPSNNQILQVQLFLNQLQQDRGFSLGGIFPLNREAVLPMLGAWTTYFLLVVQIGTTPSATTSSSQAACTLSGLALNSTD